MPSLAVTLDDRTARVENELILLCARAKVDPQTSLRMKVIASSPVKIDWDYVYQLARRHSVLPLIHAQLRTFAEYVPADHLARFKKNYEENAARNLLLTGELCRILQAFQAAGIEAVPYKGPALAVYAYGNAALRRFVDLDILVRKGDILRAKKLLTAAGFVCGPPWTDAQEELLLETQHNLSVSRDEGRLIVELHWELGSNLYASSLQADEVWSRLETMRLNSTAVKCLSLEDLLLSLCVHGSKHHWERLAWICDIAELVNRRTSLNWDVLLKRASSARNERMLFLGLYLANSLLDAPLPEQIKSRVDADLLVARLAREVSQRLFRLDGQTPLTIGQSFRFNWALRKGWQARLRYCGHVLHPSDADIESIPLPRALGFAYYFMRPFGLLRRDRQRQSVVTNRRVNH